LLDERNCRLAIRIIEVGPHAAETGFSVAVA